MVLLYAYMEVDTPPQVPMISMLTFSHLHMTLYLPAVGRHRSTSLIYECLCLFACGGETKLLNVLVYIPSGTIY